MVHMVLIEEANLNRPSSFYLYQQQKKATQFHPLTREQIENCQQIKAKVDDTCEMNYLLAALRFHFSHFAFAIAERVNVLPGSVANDTNMAYM